MNLFRRFEARLLGAMLVIVAVAAPAAAVDAHTVSHWASSVSATAHHHHTDDGRVVAGHDHHHHGHSHGHADDHNDDRSDTAPLSDGLIPDNTGHNHMPVQGVGLETINASAFEAPAMQVMFVPRLIGPGGDPPNLTPPVHNRPPRSA